MAHLTLLLGPLVILAGVVAFVAVLRSRSKQKQSLYSTVRSERERKVRDMRRRALEAQKKAAAQWAAAEADLVEPSRVSGPAVAVGDTPSTVEEPVAEEPVAEEPAVAEPVLPASTLADALAADAVADEPAVERTELPDGEVLFDAPTSAEPALEKSAPAAWEAVEGPSAAAVAASVPSEQAPPAPRQVRGLGLKNLLARVGARTEKQPHATADPVEPAAAQAADPVPQWAAAAPAEAVVEPEAPATAGLEQATAAADHDTVPGPTPDAEHDTLPGFGPSAHDTLPPAVAAESTAPAPAGVDPWLFETPDSAFDTPAAPAEPAEPAIPVAPIAASPFSPQKPSIGVPSRATDSPEDDEALAALVEETAAAEAQVPSDGARGTSPSWQIVGQPAPATASEQEPHSESEPARRSGIFASAKSLLSRRQKPGEQPPAVAPAPVAPPVKRASWEVLPEGEAPASAAPAAAEARTSWEVVAHDEPTAAPVAAAPDEAPRKRSRVAEVTPATSAAVADAPWLAVRADASARLEAERDNRAATALDGEEEEDEEDDEPRLSLGQNVLSYAGLAAALLVVALGIVLMFGASGH